MIKAHYKNERSVYDLILEDNPYHDILIKLFRRLNLINGYLYHLEVQLNKFRKNLTEQINEKDFDVSKIFVGSSIPISDLTEWTEDGWMRYYSSGNFHTQGEEYIKMVDNLIQQTAASSIQQGYEAFETFLYDVTAMYFNTSNTKNSYGFELNQCPNSFNEWKITIKQKYRSNRDILKLIRKIVPKLGEFEEKNIRNINLKEWFKVVSEVRHAITHSNNFIRSNIVTSFSDRELDILNYYYPGVYENGGYNLSISSKKAEKILGLFAEYALLIFKLLSLYGGYKWDIFKNHRT